MPEQNIASRLSNAGLANYRGYQYFLDVPAIASTLALDATDTTSVIVPKGARIAMMRVQQVVDGAITLAGTNLTRLIVYRDDTSDDILAQALPIRSGPALAAGALASSIDAAGFANPGPAQVALADATPATLKLGTGLISSGALALASGAALSRAGGLTNALRVQILVELPYVMGAPSDPEPLIARA